MLEVVPVDEKTVYGIARDVTGERLAQEKLRQSEASVRRKLNAILEPDEDLGLLHLADVIDVDEIQSLMDDFYRLTNVGIGILDRSGEVLVSTGWQDICTRFHRVHPQTRQNCVESDTVLSQDVPAGAFKLYRCKNHLWDMATPLFVGEEHLGNIFLGQFLFEGESPDRELFRDQAQRYGFDGAEYLAAFEQLPRWSRETVDAVMSFYANSPTWLPGWVTAISSLLER